MEVNFRTLKDNACNSVSRSGRDGTKLIFIHTGAVLLFSLLSTVIHYLLDQQIVSTGGLSGMGTRAVLETIQSLLETGQTILLPFWQMGYTYTILQMARGRNFGTGSLLEGFRRFGPVFRLNLIQTLIYSALAMACSYGAAFLFALTPFADPLKEAIMPFLSAGGEMDTEAVANAIMGAMEQVQIPVLALFFVVFLPFFLPLWYSYRQAGFWLMDHPGHGALISLQASKALMRGHRMELFQLDASLLWFHGLDLLVSAVLYGGFFLSVLGIQLPWTTTATSFLFLAVYCLCQLGLYVWRRNQVECTYANYYDAILPPPPPEQEM